MEFAMTVEFSVVSYIYERKSNAHFCKHWLLAAHFITYNSYKIKNILLH